MIKLCRFEWPVSRKFPESSIFFKKKVFPMQFKELEATAEAYKGGASALQEALPSCLTLDKLRKTGEDRYLSAMAKCVFRAGFVWRVVENKWPGFEAAFSSFNPLAVANYSDEKLEELAEDERIIRNLSKIKATRDNAAFILDTKRLTGNSFAETVADWPEEDIVGLWLFLKKEGNRLGGNTGPGFLRLVGKDTFVLSNDVQAALINHGFIDKISPNAKGDLLKVQTIFNDFRQQSGRPYCEISRILAFAVNHRH